MWKATKPTVSVGDVFDTCLREMEAGCRKSRCVNTREFVLEEAGKYGTKALNADLCDFEPCCLLADCMFSKDMVWLYEQRLVKSSKGREIYDSIRNSAKFDICPFCGHRNVSTVDHLLPKRQYPVFAISPDNLVPSCSDCNKLKGGGALEAKENQFIHPYFESLGDQTWLCAAVENTSGSAVGYWVHRPDCWDDVLFRRVENQFRQLKLAKLYSLQAANRMSSIRLSLGMCHGRGGANAVRDFLLVEYQSRSVVNLNSWETACYKALSDSDWYCEGGFNLD